MATAIASRYARALVDLALSSQTLPPETLAAQLASFETVLASSEELRNVLLSPAVAPARKRAVAGRLAETLGLDPLVRNFLYVVIDRRRTGLLAQMREAFETQLDQRLGIARVDVASAGELDAAAREALERELAGLTGKRVRCRYTVSDGLVGGVVARIGSTIYDGSVRGRMDTLRRRLAGAGA